MLRATSQDGERIFPRHLTPGRVIMSDPDTEDKGARMQLLGERIS